MSNDNDSKNVDKRDPQLGFAFGSAVWPGTSKVMEECAELTELLAKLVGSGGQTKNWDGVDLTARMTEEISDVRAALDFFEDINNVPRDDVRRMDKKRRFYRWHEEQKTISKNDT